MPDLIKGLCQGSRSGLNKNSWPILIPLIILILRCVPFYACIGGEIVTNGANLIDKRGIGKKIFELKILPLNGNHLKVS